MILPGLRNRKLVSNKHHVPQQAAWNHSDNMKLYHKPSSFILLLWFHELFHKSSFVWYYFMHSSYDYHRSKWNYSPKQPTWNHSRRSILENPPYLMGEHLVPTIINHGYNHFLNILYHHIELSSFTNYYCSTTQPTWANNRLANYDYGCYYCYHDWLRLTQSRHFGGFLK